MACERESATFTQESALFQREKLSVTAPNAPRPSARTPKGHDALGPPPQFLCLFGRHPQVHSGSQANLRFLYGIAPHICKVDCQRCAAQTPGETWSRRRFL